MSGGYECEDSAAKAVRKLAADVSENMTNRVNDLKRKFARMNETQGLEERRLNGEVLRLTKMLEDLRAQTHTLIERRASVQGIREKDVQELARLEADNQQLQAQIEGLAQTNARLLELKADAEGKRDSLQTKLLVMRKKHEAKITELKSAGESYRRYMGIDISRVKDRALKLEFFYLGAECYLVIDFSTGGAITDCVPELNLEKLNYMFKEGGDFYEFIRSVRNEFRMRV
ncbi:hypothetical protein PAPHI01_0579 [Pancytospora philotis]|nr:hypothetical protein PAPHI01_0579 [Pancytospora philotis]